MLEGIPAVRLSAEREADCLAIMCKGNSSRNAWSKHLGPKHQGVFRDLLVKLTAKNVKLNDWSSILRASCCDKADASLLALVSAVEDHIPEDKHNDFAADWPHIYAVRDVEWDMTCSYVNQARELAHRWYRIATNNIMLAEPGVFGQEAWFAMRRAIYGYQKPSIKFITYCNRVIRNHLMSVYADASPSAHFSKEERSLLRSFNDYRKTLAGPATLEEVAVQMGLTDEQTAALSAMLVKVINCAQIGPGRERDRLDEYDNDITSLRVGASGDLTDQPEMLATGPMMDRIKAAHLTPFEEEIFITSLEGNQYFGWQEDVASKHTNPRTGKRYTRQGAAIALENAAEKIRMTLRSDPFEDVA